MPAWEDAFCEALGRMDVPGCLRTLDEQATAHAGTPSAAVKRKALRLIRRHLGDRVRAFAQTLAESSNPTAQELGAILLAERYAEDPDDCAERLLHLADSANWEVREWVASSCGIALNDHFDQFYRVMTMWAAHPSGNVRRAVALAAMYAAAELPESCADRLLDLLEPLVGDSDPYVKRNLGPFAIGDGLLRHYPEPTLARLRRWAASSDENARWTVAMAFTAVKARPHREAAAAVLDQLAPDDRPAVQRALRAAWKNLNATEG